MRKTLTFCLMAMLLAAAFAASGAGRATKPRPVAHIVARIAVPGAGDVQAGAGAIWTNNGGKRLLRINPTTNRVVGRITLNAADPGGFAAGPNGLWITDRGTNTVLRINPNTSSVAARIPVGEAPSGVVDAYGAVWAANEHSGSVSRIDPETNRVVATIKLEAPSSNGPLAVAAAAGTIWVSVPNLDQIVRIDLATNAVTVRIHVDQECGLAATDQVVWVGAACGGMSISRIDPATNRIVVTRDMGDVPGGLHLGFGSLWSVTFSGVLVRIDQNTLRITGKLPLKGYDTEGESAAVDSHSLWIRVRGRVLRLKPAV